MRPLQPLLHEQVILVSAPAQLMSAPTDHMGASTIDGLYHSDVRVLRTYAATVTGSALEHLACEENSATSATHLALARHLDPTGADPRTLLRTTRHLHSDTDGATLTETLTLHAAWPQPVTTTLTLALSADLSPMDLVKSGRALDDLTWEHVGPSNLRVRRGAVTATLTAPGARIELAGTTVLLHWDLTASADQSTTNPDPAVGPATVQWTLHATDADAVVHAASSLPARQRPAITHRGAAAWSERALDDLNHLLLARTHTPSQPFAAAGAPWFLTLFGRDCLWTARLLLHRDDPWSLALAEGTLRTLADLQGTRTDPDTAEQPGKIMHELRRGTIDVADGVLLPPLYYGTIDATPLWILTLAEAHRCGLGDDVVADLLPALRAALTWLTDEADGDGDGFIEYLDTSGHGLANQGWKDSGDSIQHADGSLAHGPIALVEVQAYAYAAAVAGARLLRHVAGTLMHTTSEAAADLNQHSRENPDQNPLKQAAADMARADELDQWAQALRDRFTDAFWIGDLATGFPAIALDGDKTPVASLTSNIGHLLGTGILTSAQAKRVADLLTDPSLNSGYGVRTLATTMGGYWPLSYHGGSVWTHDTAIAIDGLLREGMEEPARLLAEGLLAAAPHFDWRMPELYSGRSADDGVPVAYPASCRPQAWAAAASAVVTRALDATNEG